MDMHVTRIENTPEGVYAIGTEHNTNGTETPLKVRFWSNCPIIPDGLKGNEFVMSIFPAEDGTPEIRFWRTLATREQYIAAGLEEKCREIPPDAPDVMVFGIAQHQHTPKKEQ